MAKYTIELRSLVERKYPIFDDSWTTFDPDHKQELCQKIIRHYWFNEIGSETPERFKHYLNEQLALIMPYYNQLYASEVLKLEPLYNSYVEEREGVDKSRLRNRGTASRMDINAVKEMAESIKRMTKGTSDSVGNEKLTGNEHWTEDRDIDTNETTDQSTSEDTTQKVVLAKNETGESHEVMHDDNEGTKNTTGTSHTTTSAERRYSDTPQGQLSTTGVNIERSYLTNYTKDFGSTDVDTSEDQTIKNTEDKTTDTTSTQDTTSTEDTTKGVTGKNDVSKDTITTDNLVGDKNRTHNIDDTENVVSTSAEHDFSNGSQQDRSSQTAATNETDKETEGTSRTVVHKGYSISQSELLLIYRRTFINIDQMIIRELAENFMGIF